MFFKKFEKISKYSTTKIHRKTDHISKLLAVKYLSYILYCFADLDIMLIYI